MRRITLISSSYSPTSGCCLKLLNKLMLPSTHQHRHLHAVFWLGRLRGWYSSKKRLLDVLKLHFSPASSFTLFRHPILLLWSSPLTVRQLCPSLQAVGLLMDRSITQDVPKFKCCIFHLDRIVTVHEKIYSTISFIKLLSGSSVLFSYISG